jgi:hypothetical protein
MASRATTFTIRIYTRNPEAILVALATNPPAIGTVPSERKAQFSKATISPEARIVWVSASGFRMT